MLLKFCRRDIEENTYTRLGKAALTHKFCGYAGNRIRHNHSDVRDACNTPKNKGRLSPKFQRNAKNENSHMD